ncbi:hypothetical protein PENARI_c011G05921 [Penicillium arizonense]|uniref:Uncharacterized protein n=1 Tax=Penicillium arizonense TaxID=1835702 RepID=A0A1F5LFP3_PENAI|nr:hypothetical protein PENARI_c011G05921 [Penicillium arizonense]OGE52022.1 hypothetical protein PENARI_c011G05921 [Penicillium arizonense]
MSADYLNDRDRPSPLRRKKDEGATKEASNWS